MANDNNAQMTDKEQLVAACGTCKMLSDFVLIKGKKHKNYRHFTSLDALNSIIKYAYIRFTRVDLCNDVEEGEDLAKDVDNLYYVLCTSFGRSENVALWMLYCGHNNEGVCIDLKSIMPLIVETDKIKLNKRIINRKNENDQMQDDNFTIFQSDIVYYSLNDQKNEYHINLGENANDVLESVIKGDEMLCKRKNTAWKYENECRVIIKIKKSVIKKETEIPEYCFIKIPNIKKYFEEKEIVTKSPDFNEECLKINNGGTELNSIKFTDSVLKGKIHWNLCEKCEIKNPKDDEIHE